jgi:hypothetical protein
MYSWSSLEWLHLNNFLDEYELRDLVLVAGSIPLEERTKGKLHTEWKQYGLTSSTTFTTRIEGALTAMGLLEPARKYGAVTLYRLASNAAQRVLEGAPWDTWRLAKLWRRYELNQLRDNIGRIQQLETEYPFLKVTIKGRVLFSDAQRREDTSLYQLLQDLVYNEMAIPTKLPSELLSEGQIKFLNEIHQQYWDLEDNYGPLALVTFEIDAEEFELSPEIREELAEDRIIFSKAKTQEFLEQRRKRISTDLDESEG